MEIWRNPWWLVSSWFLHINGSAQTNTLELRITYVVLQADSIFKRSLKNFARFFARESYFQARLARKICFFGLVMIDFIIGQTWQHFSFLLRCHTPLKSDIPKRRERKEKGFFFTDFLLFPLLRRSSKIDGYIFLFSAPVTAFSHKNLLIEIIKSKAV